ncbi:PIN domain-containing protein [Duganella aceris]|uniref:Type II toxin-antitoxin system VapC family toxin n=1 Tax=Duganella aceris TaxID=2703883 RepID=A0ABX0FQQ4_9BURK|nr:PIN domain-containing protein [Duganella aceris]NGZ86797.1 type II toxin-antitoxin system VapC family toxin [Duganella aceris]
MGIALFDSNILIDALRGVDQAMIELHYFKHIAISSITWMELIAKPLAEEAAGRITAAEMLAARTFIATFSVIHTNDAIMFEAAAVRADSMRHPPKIHLPDAIIQATANVTGRLLVTRNRKDFRGNNLRFPYDLHDGKIANIAAPPVNQATN